MVQTMTNPDDIKRAMLLNAEEISKLNSHIHETFRYRGNGQKEKNNWERACQEFHSRYDPLAFPGGYSTCFERIFAGEIYAIEVAVCFLECRPYFFRSGYMWKEILRKIKYASLSEIQAERVKAVRLDYDKYREARRISQQGNCAR